MSITTTKTQAERDAAARDRIAAAVERREAEAASASTPEERADAEARRDASVEALRGFDAAVEAGAKRTATVTIPADLVTSTKSFQAGQAVAFRRDGALVAGIDLGFYYGPGASVVYVVEVDGERVLIGSRDRAASFPTIEDARAYVAK